MEIIDKLGVINSKKTGGNQKENTISIYQNQLIVAYHYQLPVNIRRHKRVNDGPNGPRQTGHIAGANKETELFSASEQYSQNPPILSDGFSYIPKTLNAKNEDWVA